MRRKIISILFLIVLIFAGNTSFAVNYGYDSLDYEIDELNKQINAITRNYNGNTYSGSYSSKYNSTNSTYSNSVNNSYSNTYNSTSNSYNNSYSNTYSSLNDDYTSSSYDQNNGEYQLIIEDDANLLSASEKESLRKDMAKLTEYGNIIFKSINTNSTSAASYAKSYYNGRFGRQSGTVFLIDMDNRKIYIFSNGDNYTKITESKAETITDNIYQYATDKEYYECAKKAYEQILTVLEGGKIAEPMKYISNAVLAVMVSLFINFAIFKLATNNAKATGNEQIKECERFFEHTTPIVNKVGTRRVYSPVSDSSSGGGSSGGGGGGRRRRWRRPQLLN